jgi:hypothetical protein
VKKRKELGERSRRARGLRGLAVLSALGVGALGLAAPAHADDPLSQPPPISTGTADRSVQVVADVPEQGSSDAQPAVPAGSPPPAPDPAPADDAVRPVETPANQAPVPAPPDPGPPAEPTAPGASAPTVSSEPVRAAPAARPMKKAVRAHRAHARARQYQRPAPQYQSTVAASHEIAGDQSGNGVAPAPSARPPDIKSDGWNCSENIPDTSPLCPPNACQSSSWNCCWIDACTSGIPVVDAPSKPVVPEPPTQPAAPICTETGEPGPQYQSGEGQYQPPAGPAEEESGLEPELDPCQQAPVVAPGADTTSAATAETSDVPDAVQPASSPVVPEATAVPSQPPGSAASANSTPPPDAHPVEPAVARLPSKRATAVAPAVAVLGETVSETRARPVHVVAHLPRRLRSKPSRVKTLPQAERAVAAPASASTSLPGRGNSWRLWFVFAAVALLGLAFSSFVLPARALPRAPRLDGVRSRIGSKGLDANASVGPKRASRGIRYRD